MIPVFCGLKQHTDYEVHNRRGWHSFEKQLWSPRSLYCGILREPIRRIPKRKCHTVSLPNFGRLPTRHAEPGGGRPCSNIILSIWTGARFASAMRTLKLSRKYAFKEQHGSTNSMLRVKVLDQPKDQCVNSPVKFACLITLARRHFNICISIPSPQLPRSLRSTWLGGSCTVVMPAQCANSDVVSPV